LPQYKGRYVGEGFNRRSEEAASTEWAGSSAWYTVAGEKPQAEERPVCKPTIE